MHLLIGDTKVPYELVRSRRRQIRITFAREAPRLIIETPKGKLDRDADQFLRDKSDWILKHFHIQLEVFQQRQQFFANLDQGKLLYQGKHIDLSFQQAKSRRIRKVEHGVLIEHRKGDLEKGRAHLVYPALRAMAKAYLTQKTYEWAKDTQSRINGVRVKDHKSKWGSCSNLSNINLNWSLIFLPEDLIDYVIIHELMHLRQMNHSPAYWAEVAKYVPDYKAKRKRVKEYGWVIGMFALESSQSV